MTLFEVEILMQDLGVTISDQTQILFGAVGCTLRRPTERHDHQLALAEEEAGLLLGAVSAGTGSSNGIVSRKL